MVKVVAVEQIVRPTGSEGKTAARRNAGNYFFRLNRSDCVPR